MAPTLPRPTSIYTGLLRRVQLRETKEEWSRGKGGGAKKQIVDKTERGPRLIGPHCRKSVLAKETGDISSRLYRRRWRSGLPQQLAGALRSEERTVGNRSR